MKGFDGKALLGIALFDLEKSQLFIKEDIYTKHTTLSLSLCLTIKATNTVIQKFSR